MLAQGGSGETSSSALSCQFQLLSFATLFTWLESAAMPRFIFGVDYANHFPQTPQWQVAEVSQGSPVADSA
jgi:hypothetical protein